MRSLVKGEINKKILTKTSLEEKKQTNNFSRFLRPSFPSSKSRNQNEVETNEKSIIEIFEIDKSEYEELCTDKFEIERFEEEFQKKSFEEKFELFKEGFERHLSSLESNIRIRELESNYQMLKEEKLQREIDIIEKVIY